MKNNNPALPDWVFYLQEGVCPGDRADSFFRYPDCLQKVHGLCEVGFSGPAHLLSGSYRHHLGPSKELQSQGPFRKKHVTLILYSEKGRTAIPSVPNYESFKGTPTFHRHVATVAQHPGKATEGCQGR
jgi:hypothetical protein